MTRYKTQGVVFRSIPILPSTQTLILDMAANYSHNGHLFTIQGSSLVLRVQSDEGRYEVASFLKFIESAENFKVAASVTNLTLEGRNRQLKGGDPVSSLALLVTSLRTPYIHTSDV